MPYNSYYPQYSAYQQPYPTTYSPQSIQPTTMPIAQAPTRSMLNGRVIGDVGEISPQDVPMDGTRSVFPTMDGSTIYVKSWNSDGTIRTERYVKVTEPDRTDSSVERRLSDIEARLASLEKGPSKPNSGYQKPRRDRMNDDSDTSGNAQ